jgi:hypothetical protein
VVARIFAVPALRALHALVRVDTASRAARAVPDFVPCDLTDGPTA